MKEKTCNCCKGVFEIDLFYKNKEMKDGHINICKKCYLKKRKENRDANPAKGLIRLRKWRAKNIDKVNFYAREYYKRNKERCLKRGSEYRERNRDYFNLKNKEWRGKNKEKYDSLHKEWLANNKDKVKGYRKKYKNDIVRNLSDGYVKQLLELKGCEIPVGMIEAKRLQILINRKIKEAYEKH